MKTYRRYLTFSVKQILLDTKFLIFTLVFALFPVVPLLCTYIDRFNSRGEHHMLEFAFLFLCGIGTALAIITPFWMARAKTEMRALGFSCKKQLLTCFMQLIIIAGIWSLSYLLVYLLMAGIFSPLLAARGVRPVWVSKQTPFFKCLLAAFCNLLCYVGISLLISTATKRRGLAIVLNILLVLVSFAAAIPIDAGRMFPEGVYPLPGTALYGRLQLFSFLVCFNPGSLSAELATTMPINNGFLLKILFSTLLFVALMFFICLSIAAIQDHLEKKKTA